jgi:flagellar biosynthesis/type III secretory pathway chaperone
MSTELKPALQPSDLDAAQLQVQALDALLQAEYEVLRNREFERLEPLQAEKVTLLTALQATATQVAALDEPPEAWSRIVATLDASRDAFRRNEALLSRQVEVVRQTLRALQSADPTATVDLYDRLGQMSRRGGRRLYSEA